MRLLRSVGTWVLAGAVMLVAAGVARAQKSQTNGQGSSQGNSQGSGSTATPTPPSPDMGGFNPYSASQGGGWPVAGQNGSASGHGSSSNEGEVPQTQQQMEEQQAKLRNAERQKQLVSDTQKLVALVNELQTDVDKSTKDTLSLDVIRKAEEIEKLAHNVRDRMKNAN